MKKLKFWLLVCFSIGTLSVQAAELPGSLDWGKSVTLGFLNSGRIVSVNAHSGQSVKAGEVLLKMDVRALEAEVQLQKAVLQRAKSQAEAHPESGSAAAVNEAQAKLALATVALENAQVLAPFDGRVVSVYAVPGQVTVNRCQMEPLLVLVDDKTMLARVEVSLEQRRALQAAQAFEVSFAGKRYPAVLNNLGWTPLGNAEQAYYQASFLFHPEPSDELPGAPLLVHWQ